MGLAIEKFKVLVTSTHHPRFAIGSHLNTVYTNHLMIFIFASGWQRFHLVIFTQKFNLELSRIDNDVPIVVQASLSVSDSRKNNYRNRPYVSELVMEVGASL